MQGFCDTQIDTLIDILSLGRIWSCNVGENFLVSGIGWRKFQKSIPDTSLAFTYVSEAHLQRLADLKVLMRAAIRLNRILSPRREPDVCKHISNMWCVSLNLCSAEVELSLNSLMVLRWVAESQTTLHVLASDVEYSELSAVVSGLCTSIDGSCARGAYVECSSVRVHADSRLPAGSTHQVPLPGDTTAVLQSPSMTSVQPTQRPLQKLLPSAPGRWK